jgi:large subunit ribosomal protein L18
MSKKSILKSRRVNRIRAKIKGTAECPRFVVFRSLRAVYAQIIDDSKGSTLVSFDSRSVKGGKNDVKTAEKVGAQIAKLAVAKKIEEVIFDRHGNKYHGKVKAVAEGARKEGLKF